MTHRTVAVLLVLHPFGVVLMLRRRRRDEAPVVATAAAIALSFVLLQLVVASAMVLLHLPAVLRSLHEATGVGIWLSCFVLAYLARRAASTGARLGSVDQVFRFTKSDNGMARSLPPIIARGSGR
jgi:heme A synthase